MAVSPYHHPSAVRSLKAVLGQHELLLALLKSELDVGQHVLGEQAAGNEGSGLFPLLKEKYMLFIYP